MQKLLVNILLLCHLSAAAVTFSPDAKRNCQQMDSVNGTVTLIFCTDHSHFGVPRDSLLGIWVSGSINDLGDTTLGYRLDEWSEDSCLYHTFSCAELEKPGNSGQPEFVFYFLKTDSTCGNIYPHKQRQAQIDPRLVFHNGIDFTLILLPCGADYFTTDLDALAARDAEAREIKPLSEFDLTDSVDQHRISNFRLAPGTRHLYRSYHPYYPSNSRYDTEERRLYWCAKLGQQAGIRSNISLTGSLESQEGQWYHCGSDSFQITIPDYQQQIIANGDMLYVGNKVGRNPSVTECYYHSEDTVLAQYMREIVQFLADTSHPMPVQIHCAIGADRTGFVCAVIAALCGADWQSIAADYMETGNMRIQTYRHPNRLIYALERMTGLRPDRCTAAQLAAAIRTHLVNRMQVLTHAEIDAMVARLTGSAPAGMESVNTGVNTPCVVYDILGRKVSATTTGVQIRIGAQGGCTKQVVRP